MKSRFSSLRAVLVVAAVALVATMALPAIASATTFSASMPLRDSSTSITKPKITVYVVEKNGIKGATSFTMKVDGVSVTPKVTSRTSRGVKRFTLTYQVRSALRLGTHTVYMRFRDSRKAYHTASWKFVVKEASVPTPPDPTLPAMPVTIDPSDCGACHVGYPAAHPMTACELCHGSGRPIDGTPYTPDDESAHTLDCALEPSCHGGGGDFPHVLSPVCAQCHSGGYSGIPTTHSINAEASHFSNSTLCIASGCHVSSLTVEHYRRSIGGVKLSCATCHSSTDPRIRSAIRAGSTRCESCHSLTAGHYFNAADHAISGGCVATGCHAASAVTVHSGVGGPGCDACHAAGKTPSTVCSTCHPGTVGQVHAIAAVAHTATSSTCITDICHVADVTAIHGAVGGPGCVACHAAGKTPSVDCVTCHPGAIATIHPNIGTAHTAPVDGCVSSVCHARDVTTVHGASGGPGCAACHKAGTSSTIACAACHPGDLTGRHSAATAKHTATAANTCVAAGCHAANVAALHGVTGGPGCIACHGPGKTPSTVCSPCHSSNLTTVHPNQTAKHTAPAGTCVSASCHLASVTAIHGVAGGPGCAACHAAGKTLTLVCTVCHAGDLVSLHTSATAKHTAPTSTCVQSACHGSNAAVLHRGLSGSGCSSCHAVGKTPSLVCTNCHTGDLTSRHTSATAKHTAPTSSCVTTGCHTSNVATVHGATGGPGCAACHAPGKTPSLVCATCHVGSISTLHAAAAAKHTAPASTCVQTGCHGTDAASLHTQTGGPGCAACHAVGVTASLTCATCHTGDLTSRHTSATTKHTAPTSSCVTTGCHGANVASMHGVAGGPGCAACHAPGKTPVLTCGTCHVGSITTLHASATAKHTAPVSTCVQTKCHASDAAALHTQTGGPSCGACHAAGKTPTVTCAVCHTGDLTSRHASATTKHTAPAGTCVSATCHVSNVATLHAAGLGCVDCHAPGKTPSLACATCHSADIVSIHPAAGSKHLATSSCVQAGCHLTDAARIHAVTGGPGCAACHAAGKTPSLSCTTCHPGGFTTAHPAPAAAHTVAASSCVTAGCHAADAAGLHTRTGGPGCSACHAAGKTPSLVCANCHNTDPAVLHPNAAISHTSPASSCVTAGCHVADVVASHNAPGGPGCSACHGLLKTPSVVCTTCHTGHGFTLHPAFASAHTAPASTCVKAGCHGAEVTVLHGMAGGTGCTACHSIHGAGAPGCAACHATGKTLTLTCVTCHSSDLAVVHPAEAAKHTAPAGACVASGCHTTDAAALHTKTGGPGCAACHAAGVTATLVCSTCHSTNLATVHPTAAAKHAAPAGTCVTAGCHLADVAGLHTKTGGPGCGACHAAGKNPSLVCSNCHVGDIGTLHPQAAASHAAPASTCVKAHCHVSDATLVHGQPGGPGCSACHALGKTPSLVCANCHPGTFGTLHTVSGPPHAAMNGGCIQAGCHVSNVITLHSPGPSCDACHAIGVTPTITCGACHVGDITAVHAPAVGTKHTASGSCGGSGCHSTNVATLHQATGGPGCAACHATGKVPTVDCSVCHGSFTSSHPVPEAAHTAPAAGPCQGCHELNVATLHNASGGPSCAACHATGVTASTWCDDCHGRDAVIVAHPTAATSHTASQHPCTTAGECHGSNVAVIHQGSFANCNACHMNGAATTRDCDDCHDWTITYKHAGGGPLGTGGPAYDYHGTRVGTGSYDYWGWVSQGTLRAPYARGQNLACSVCHDLRGTPNIYNFKTQINGKSISVTTGTQYNELCSACHAGTLAQWHAGCAGCHDGGGHPVGMPLLSVLTDCGSCHKHGSPGWQHGPAWLSGPTL